MNDKSINGKLLKSKITSDAKLSDLQLSSQTFEIALNICLSSGFPIAICWGHEFTFFYNDNYISILGDKHPAAMAAPVKEVYAEVWNILETNLLLVVTEFQTLKFNDAPFLLNRNGYLEECYFDYTLSPIISTAGVVEGVFNVVLETTSKIISDRRNKILNQFTLLQKDAHNFKFSMDACTKILDGSKHDIPFYLLYIKGKDQIYKLVASSGLPEAQDEVKWPVESVINSGEPAHIKSINEFLKQPIVTFFPEPCCEALIVPLKQNSGVVSGYLIAGISPRKRLDDDYKYFIENVGLQINMCFNNALTFEKFLQLEQEKDNLIGIISHELKTPITGIKAYAQLATKQLIQQGYTGSAELIQKMTGQIAKLNLIVSDMVDGTNFLTGKVKFQNEEFDVDELIRGVVSEFKQNGCSQQIELDLNIGSPFNSDKARIEQIIFNLVSNAIKYSSDEQSIEIASTCLNDQLMVSVRDYGIGISAEDQTRIFDRFYRSVNIEQYTFPGMGLGLFIVREIVAHLGGKIWVNSTEAQGSIFYITLPFHTDKP